jgi:hypothetical protein
MSAKSNQSSLIKTEFRADIEEEKDIMVIAKKKAKSLQAIISKEESDSIYYRSYVILDSSSLESIQSSLFPRSFTIPSLAECFVNKTPISPDIMSQFVYYYSVIRFQFITALHDMSLRLEKANSSHAGYIMVSTGSFSKYLYDNTQSFGDFDFQIMPHYNGHLLNKHVDYKFIRANLKLNLILNILEVCNFINYRFIPRYINTHLADDSPLSVSLRNILQSYRIRIHHSYNITPISTPGTTEHREGRIMIVLENIRSFNKSYPNFITIKLVDFVFDYDYVMPHYDNLKSMSPFVVKAVCPLMKLVNDVGYVAFKTFHPKDILKEKMNIMDMNHNSTYLYQKAHDDKLFWERFI